MAVNTKLDFINVLNLEIQIKSSTLLYCCLFARLKDHVLPFVLMHKELLKRINKNIQIAKKIVGHISNSNILNVTPMFIRISTVVGNT